jgi:hypothetical protein
MNANTSRRVAFVLGGVLAALLSHPGLAEAHCDSLDGPVVNSARVALEEQNADLVLVWVQPEHAQELKEAFERTLRVRAQGEEVRQLADLWFFETLVRLHREGEGAPYTGLKPEGWKPPALVAAADHALEDGQVAPLATEVGDHITREIVARYERVRALQGYDASDVEAGRRYVAAYVEYVHLLEAIHGMLHGEVGHALHPNHQD